MVDGAEANGDCFSLISSVSLDLVGIFLSFSRYHTAGKEARRRCSEKKALALERVSTTDYAC